jgi:hypothetical protein
MRGSYSPCIFPARAWHPSPPVRPAFTAEGCEAATPSDDEDEVVGPAKVEEGVKEEEKIDTGDATKKEEQDCVLKKEDASNKSV